MNYQLPNSYQKELIDYPDEQFHNYDDTEESYQINRGLRYGDMPSEMLMSKFDETNLDFDTYQPLENLDNHWRTTLKDLSPQPSSLESDMRRTDNQSKSFLNHRYHGTRGNSDVEVHHPEMFLGFHGEEDREERGGGHGTNPLEPDMKEFTKQQQARLKYIRFTPDASNHVTGLGRSEAKVQADNQEVFRQNRHRMKIFDTSFDGRRNGLATQGINNEALVYKQKALEDNYSDRIKQAAMIRNRKTTVLSNKLFRNTNEYHQFTSDHRFKVASYGENPRRFAPYHPLEAVIMNIATENELAYMQEHADSRGKAANVLMGKIVLQRRKAENDVEKGKSAGHIISKTKAQEKELKAVLSKVSHDDDKQESIHNDTNDRGKTAKRVDVVSQKSTQNEEQDRKKSQAVLMYKSVKGSIDHIKAKNMISMDQDSSNSIDTPSSGKTAKRSKTHKGGKVINDVQMTVDGKSLSIKNYKSVSRKNHRKNVDNATLDGHRSNNINKNTFGKTAPKIGVLNKNSRAGDVVVQDGYTEHVRDVARLRSNGGTGSLSERGASSSVKKSSTDHTEGFANGSDHLSGSIDEMGRYDM